MVRNAVTRHSEGADSAADLWAAAAAADPSWDSMSGERESRGRLCEHIARLSVGMKWARIDLSLV